MQRQINDDVPYIWYDRAQWAVIAANSVRGITNGPLPTGRGQPDRWPRRLRWDHLPDPDLARVMIIGVAGHVLGGRAGDAASPRRSA